MSHVMSVILSGYLPAILHILYLLVAAGLSYVGAHFIHSAAAKKLYDIFDGIVLKMVDKFNIDYVQAAKKDGTWTASDGPAIKQRAIDAVKSQYKPLFKLGTMLLGDLESHIGMTIDQTVQNNHIAQPQAQPQQNQ